MQQVDLDQIVGNKIPSNPVKPMPRDLSGGVGTGSVNHGIITELSIPADLGNPFTSNDPTTQGDAVSHSIATQAPPSTPSLISVKSQTFRIKSDGTGTVDVVLQVEDIRGVTDYEVRISKDARNI